MIPMTTRRGTITAAAISPPDNEEPEDVLPDVTEYDVLPELEEVEEEVLLQIYTPEQDPLLHVSFTVQALESLH